MNKRANVEMTEKLFCNCCGRELRLIEGVPGEGACRIHQEWGYFSDKDGETHEFILCEKCYDNMISKFVRPVKITERTEIL